jgi:tetratricopeptide (TPR) repeat protein
VNSESLDIIQAEYQIGRTAFEGGRYREAVQHLEKASALVARNTRLGGEVQIWLVTAYEATGQRQAAIALCQQLSQHPDLETRKQGRRLLYILEAPKLSRRDDWMTQIPDLSNLADNPSPEFQGKAAPTELASPPSRFQLSLESTDLDQVNTEDNHFVWIALGAIILVIAGLIGVS